MLILMQKIMFLENMIRLYLDENSFQLCFENLFKFKMQRTL